MVKKSMEAEVRELVQKCGLPELDWIRFWDPTKVQLDGDFSVQQLEVIIEVMKKHIIGE